jgi:RNA polymerase sigma factor (sigma-70 family)
VASSASPRRTRQHVEGCTCQDRDAFEAVYRAEARALRAFLTRGAGDPATGDDLTAETFAKAFGGWESYRGEASRRSWLWRIAHNTLKNWRRSRARDRAIAAGASPDVDARIADADAYSVDVPIEQRSAVWELLARIPGERARTAVYLRYVEGRTVEEVAAVLGASASAVTSATSRALAALRDQLEERR